MSLQVNLSSPDIKAAYDDVLGGKSEYLILTYEKGSNDLKVQSLDCGTLDDALFEFSSGRIQFGFVRVVDPNTQLPKFVLINWCGEGVPESRKGLFATHSASVGQYLRNYHVSINARREDDLDSKAILKKVTDSSGSKYAAAGQGANTQGGGRIEPVGSSYKPIGTPDIAALRSGAKKDVISPVGTNYSPARDELANIRSGKPDGGVPAAPRPEPSGPPKPVAPPAPQSAPAVAPLANPGPVPKAPAVGGIVGNVPAPPAVAPQAATLKPAIAPAADRGPAKPDSDDRIKPVGTTYEPVRLGKPGKLGANRFPFANAEPETPARAPAPRPSGGLTWSQRQEKAKKEREEEEARSKNAAAKAAGVGVGAGSLVGVGAGVGAVAANDEDTPPPPPPAPAAPPAPPAPSDTAVTQTADTLQKTSLDEGTAEAVAAPSGGTGQRAVAIYEYAAAEDNEISFAEGDTITGIEQVDEGWWSGVSPNGQEGLFPATYVELLDEESDQKHDDIPPPPPPPPAPVGDVGFSQPPQPEPTGDEGAPPPPPPPPPPAPPAAAAEEPPAAPAPPPPPPPPTAPAPEQSSGPYAITQYDYEAAEDNELGFNEGDKIVAIEFASDEWWSGTLERTGDVGLFPANYVELHE